MITRGSPLMWSHLAHSDASGDSNANGNGERKTSAYNLRIVVLRRQRRPSRKYLHLRYRQRIYSPTTRLLGGALAGGSRSYNLVRSAYYGRTGSVSGSASLCVDHNSFNGGGSLGTKVMTLMPMGPAPSWQSLICRGVRQRCPNLRGFQRLLFDFEEETIVRFFRALLGCGKR